MRRRERGFSQGRIEVCGHDHDGERKISSAYSHGELKKSKCQDDRSEIVRQGRPRGTAIRGLLARVLVGAGARPPSEKYHTVVFKHIGRQHSTRRTAKRKREWGRERRTKRRVSERSLLSGPAAMKRLFGLLILLVAIVASANALPKNLPKGTWVD